MGGVSSGRGWSKATTVVGREGTTEAGGETRRSSIKYARIVQQDLRFLRVTRRAGGQRPRVETLKVFHSQFYLVTFLVT